MNQLSNTDPAKMAAIYAQPATQSHAEAVHSIQAQNTPSPFAEIQRLQDQQREGWVPMSPLQNRVHPWLLACFGAEITGDKKERNHRFLEESIELVQSTGCTQSESHQLVDYVFNRPVGEPHQEVGGVMITLAALCLANGLDMDAAGEDELARIWTKVDKIRAKQAAKPKHSPLAEECNAPDYPQQITELNQRLIERQESNQAQLIRIEDTWREKLLAERAERNAKIAEQAAQIVALRKQTSLLRSMLADERNHAQHVVDSMYAISNAKPEQRNKLWHHLIHVSHGRMTWPDKTPPPVVPLEDVKPLVEALTRYDCHDCLTTEQQQDANDTLKTFNSKHPL